MKTTETDHADSSATEPEFIAAFGEHADKRKEETEGLSWWETRLMPLGREGLLDEAEATYVLNPEKFSQMDAGEFEEVVKEHVFAKRDLDRAVAMQQELQGLKLYYVENIAKDEQYNHPDKSWANLLDQYYSLSGFGIGNVEFNLIAEASTQSQAKRFQDELWAMRGHKKGHVSSKGDALTFVNNLASAQGDRVTEQKIDYSKFILKTADEHTDAWKEADGYINSPQIQRILALNREEQAA